MEGGQLEMPGSEQVAGRVHPDRAAAGRVISGDAGRDQGMFQGEQHVLLGRKPRDGAALPAANLGTVRLVRPQT